MRRTKILATLGPRTRGRDQVRALVDAGANAFRLNFSHGQPPEHEAAVAVIRAIEAEMGRPIAILQDLQGPKIRVGDLASPEGIDLVAGRLLRLDADRTPGDATRVGVSPRVLLDELPVGSRVLLRDGLIELTVETVLDDALLCRVVNDGHLTAHAGINVPDCDLSVPALTDKDREDLAFGAYLGVDWVALSFVRRPEDLVLAREEMVRLGSAARLMAKIEKPSAVARFEAVLAEADGIMVARGDLGVELPAHEVPVVQRRLVRRCVEAGKPVVVATQMLESMIVNPRPTRAEASDVATAIYELADAVMLSGETAAGAHPVAAVATMARIAETVEASEDFVESLHRWYAVTEPELGAALTHSACRLAQVLPAAVVATYTMTGATARRAARHRPGAIVAPLTPNLVTARQLQLGWGLAPMTVEVQGDSEDLIAAAREHLLAAGLLSPGQAFVVTAGLPYGQPGRTNLLRVERG
ncbi:MAG: pyruvate kinase [Armatimonadetes bacterium]|nr:pyruvate kinase [Armatimonadota bacterium]